MNKEKQVKAMAMMDGYIIGTFIKDGVCFMMKQDGIGKNKHPGYDTDNDMDRMVRELSMPQLDDYMGELHEVVGSPCEHMIELQATPAQKREAYLKANGLWG